MNKSFKNICRLLLFGLAINFTQTGIAENQKFSNDKGYYKDIFMDAGINLTSRTDLSAARYLNLSMEKFVSADHKTTRHIQLDTLLQRSIINGNPIDENGILLFPDGAPRFRMIYMNGGKAMNHGRTLDVVGRGRITDFVNAGGSYVGTCAGAYLASKYTRGDSLKAVGLYIGLWPGSVRSTGMGFQRHGVTLEKNSPLLKYYDFGGDMKIDTVYHNGGCYGDEEQMWPKNGEVLARYNTDGIKTTRPVNGAPVIWSYKANENTGRVISCGSHPEKDADGERLQLMSALIKYAMDGNGPTHIKGQLEMGVARKMTARTQDNCPDFTRIGDGQYHHFTIDVPAGLDTLTISLDTPKGWESYDLYLLADKEELAWLGESKWQDINLGAKKTLRIPAPQAGKYYISVYGASKVETKETDRGTFYTENLAVLNGIPYILGVNLPKPQTQKK